MKLLVDCHHPCLAVVIHVGGKEAPLPISTVGLKITQHFHKRARVTKVGGLQHCYLSGSYIINELCLAPCSPHSSCGTY